MAGLYLHIPFCRKACIYCDFHFSTSLSAKDRMIAAMQEEIKIQVDFFGKKSLQSIYFGGGTPSVLTEKDIQSLIETIHKFYDVNVDAEITLEANPDDLTNEKIMQLSKSSINRLSIGVQSFRNQDLKLMNRSHNAQQAENSIKNAQDLGLTNISLDLIYAQPNMPNPIWVEQIEKAIQLDVPHISSYALTVEPKTVLQHKINNGEIKEVADFVAAEQFHLLVDSLHNADFEHYEVSNFAKKGHRAVHNSAYWQGLNYLGIGPSAHSFKKGERLWNVSNNSLYIKALEKGELAQEGESLSLKDQYNEWLMISLRTIEGLELNELKTTFGKLESQFKEEVIPLIDAGKLEQNEERIWIPKKWRFHSDGIAAALFYI